MFLDKNSNFLLVQEEEIRKKSKKLFVFLIVSLSIYAIYFLYLIEVSKQEQIRDFIYRAAIQ